MHQSPLASASSRLLSAENRVVEEANYTIATSDFLVSRGGDGYTMLKEGKVLTDSGDGSKGF